jgi:hypothetical protein
LINNGAKKSEKNDFFWIFFNLNYFFLLIRIENVLFSRVIAAKFTIFLRVNSRKKFTLFRVHSIFFLPVWTANKAKIASHGLFHKKSFVFPIRGGNMDCFEYERFFVKKSMRGYFSFVCRPFR